MMWRYRVTLLLIVFGFFLIISRLFYWQVVRAEELSVWGKAQYGQTITIPALRGEIRTSDGYPIATNKISYLLFANPKAMKIDEKEKVGTILSSLLSIDSASVSASLNKDLFWVPIQRDISIDLKNRLDQLKLAGIGFEQDNSRFYPEGSMAAQLIGFVGKDNIGDDKGYFGLEGYYDRQLKGKEGVAVQIKDAFGRPILAKATSSSGQIDGRSLTLSIDRALQYAVEKKLKDSIDKFGAASGTAIIMDPKTGNILAMSSFPSFDPLNFKNYDPTTFVNPVVSDLYEPGSTFKALVMASGIDAGVVKPDTKCTICGGPVTIGDYQIHTWNNQYKDNIDMTEVIQRSDNTGMVFVSQKLGIDKMLSYLKKFGIGEPTGIDLQGETSGVLREKDAFYPIDVATLSFGQGISVTPIELLDAFSALANDGKRMEPHVVTQVQTADGQTINIPPKVLDTPVSSATAKVMKEMLVNAVENGEAKFAAIKGYKVAGKTGTAQIPIAGHYDPNKTIASFIGFAPADDPKFTMLVIINQPTTSIYGAETAAPVFFDIARDLFSYYDIPPSE